MTNKSRFGLIAIAILAVAMLAVMPAMACPPQPTCPPGEVWGQTGEHCYQVPAVYGPCQNCPYIPTQYGPWGPEHNGACGHQEEEAGTCEDWWEGTGHYHHHDRVIISAGHYQCHTEGYVSCDGAHHEKLIITPAHQQCDPIFGCIAVTCPAIPCDAGFECIFNQCVPIQGYCDEQTPCNEGYHCEENQCVPDVCGEDFTCDQGFHCSDNGCVPDVCGEDFHCETGFHCSDEGICVENPEAHEYIDLIEQFGDMRLVTAGYAAMLSMGNEPVLEGEGTGLEYGFVAAPEYGVEGSKYVRLLDTCKEHVLYIELKTATEVQNFQIYYYRAGDGLFVNNYEKIMPWSNFVERGRFDYTGGVLVLTAQNPNTAIHSYARLRTLDPAAYGENFGMQMTVRGSSGNVLWTGHSEIGKRDMSVIFILDPFERCVHPADLVNAHYNAGTWHGLPK